MGTCSSELKHMFTMLPSVNTFFIRSITDSGKSRIDETATPATAAMTASETPSRQHGESKYDSDNYYDDDPDDDDTMVIGSAIGQ
jgi:hypothetical protein